MADEKSIKEQLAEIEAEEALEREAAKLKAEKARIERHKLKKAMMAKTGGDEGEKFAIIETKGGFVAVSKPQKVIWKAFQTSEKSDADFEGFIKCCVDPENKDPSERERVARICEDFPGARDRILAAIAALEDIHLEGAGKR